MSLTFERKLPIILFFVFLMLTTIGFLFYLNTISTQEAIARGKRAQGVIQKLDETLALSLETQPATTGFLLTGSDTYLEPFNRAKPKISQNIGQLRLLTANNNLQAQELDVLDTALREHSEEATRKIDIRKSQGYEAALAEVPWRQGKDTVDRIRGSIDRIKSIEVAALQKGEQELDIRQSRAIWTLIGSSIAGIISLGLANIVVLLEIKKRRLAQNELIDANSDLEKKIERRTTELKNANEQLSVIAKERETILLDEQSARREAEIANRLRDEFMASVSHELRTPLNSILGWARMMKGGELDERQSEKALTTIIKNSETQNRLIEDLLDVARVISGKLQLELAEIDPIEIVSNSIETVRPLAEAKNIKIDLAFESPEHPHIITGDRNRLTQIFTNLLTNAIKFSPDRAGISVSVSFEDGKMKTEIKDAGKGISPEFLPLVFERFRQDTTNASNSGGLGLGLAIVRNLVEMHGGAVSAESAGENKGSKFTVILPAAENNVKGSLIPDQQFDGVQQIRGDNVG